MVPAVIFAGDRLRAAIEAVVRALAPDPVALGAWPATVSAWDDVAQVAELTTPAGSPLPPVLRAVPLLVDPPGTRVAIDVGTAVLVAFRGGDYGQPYARPAAAFGAGGFAPSALALGGASGLTTSTSGEPVARQGDAIEAGVLSLVPIVPPTVPPTATLTWAPSIGPSVVLGVVPIVSPGAPAFLDGTITSGSTVVRSA